MSRYREITVAEMDPAQKRVHDQIVSGKRGRFGGPFQLLIRAPGVCEHAAPLGEYLRWGTSLPDRLSELAIITTARFWRAQYEWYAHAPLAEAGRGAGGRDRGDPHRRHAGLRGGRRKARLPRLPGAVPHAAALRPELQRGDRRLRRTRRRRDHQHHRLLHADREHAQRVPGAAARRGGAAVSGISGGGAGRYCSSDFR